MKRQQGLFAIYSTLRNIFQDILQNISHAKYFTKCSLPLHNALTWMNDFHKSVQTNEKWQLMENKGSINNKNVKQLLENDYLLIHCLTR